MKQFTKLCFKVLSLLLLGFVFYQNISHSQVLVLVHDSTVATSLAKRDADKDSLLKYLPGVFTSGYTLNTFDTSSTFPNLSNYCTIFIQETSFDAAPCRYLGLAARNQLIAWLNGGTPGNKRTLIMMGGDLGYNYDRSGSAGRDTNFSRSYGGYIYLTDNGNLTSGNGIYKITGNIKDSITTSPSGGGFYPDNVRLTNSAAALYGYSGRGNADSLSCVSRITANYNFVSLTVDARYFTNRGGTAPNPDIGLSRVLKDLVQYITANGGCSGPPAPVTTPNLIYYKFENNPNATTILNCADGGVGMINPTLTGVTLAPGGQFDSCLTGANTPSAGITTGWNLNLGSSSWTISMWVDLPTTTFGYLFGDAGPQFRCFNNGAAGTNAITLRGTGITNVNVTGMNTGPVVIHFVYDSAASNIKTYKNGVLFSTVNQTPLNIATGTGFKVGGYSTSACLTGKLDEFRIYRRALSQGEVSASFDSNITCAALTGISNNNQLPTTFSLSQNYPNPFNPNTNIKFAIPKAGNVKLTVFDILGREVTTLVNEIRPAGYYTVDFNAATLSSGIYFYRIESGDFKESRKMLLVK